MSVKAVGVGPQVNQVAKPLPQDLAKVVGKVRLAVVDVVAKIIAFFRTLFYGSLSTWKGFWQDVNTTTLDIANEKKMSLYKHHKKLSADEKAFMELTGYEVYTKEDIARLKTLNKDLKVYQVFKATISEKDFQKVKALLKQIENTNAPNYYAVLVSLRKLANNPDVPKDIRELINQKLKQVALTSKKPVQYLPEKPEYTRPMWQKVAIGALVAAVVIGAGYGAYSYFGSNVTPAPHGSGTPKVSQTIIPPVPSTDTPTKPKPQQFGSSPDTPEGKAALKAYYAEKAQEAEARLERIREAARAAHNPKVFTGPVSSPDTPEGQAALAAYYAEKAQEEAASPTSSITGERPIPGFTPVENPWYSGWFGRTPVPPMSSAQESSFSNTTTCSPADAPVKPITQPETPPKTKPRRTLWGMFMDANRETTQRSQDAAAAADRVFWSGFQEPQQN